MDRRQDGLFGGLGHQHHHHHGGHPGGYGGMPYG
ncbi:unnamed protein product, partial [Rotaria sp. Silwood2]